MGADLRAVLRAVRLRDKHRLHYENAGVLPVAPADPRTFPQGKKRSQRSARNPLFETVLANYHHLLPPLLLLT